MAESAPAAAAATAANPDRIYLGQRDGVDRPPGQATACFNRVQIEATLGPDVPPWPDADHASGNLREFGLVATLDGGPVLINYVTHPLIAKDPASTLERTIWIVF